MASARILFNPLFSKGELLMRSRKNNIFAIIFLFVFVFCGCQKGPDTKIITSKNDGIFDSNAIQSADETHSDGEKKQSLMKCFIARMAPLSTL